MSEFALSQRTRVREQARRTFTRNFVPTTSREQQFRTNDRTTKSTQIHHRSDYQQIDFSSLSKRPTSWIKTLGILMSLQPSRTSPTSEVLSNVIKDTCYETFPYKFRLVSLIFHRKILTDRTTFSFPSSKLLSQRRG